MGAERSAPSPRPGPARLARVGLLLGLIPALIGLLLARWPAAAWLELAGLDSLFLLRGERPPPTRVLVIAIDEDSYEVLGHDTRLPWPRATYAALIRALTAEGARAIAFDVLMEDPAEPAQDAALEAAIRESGIVVLGSSVEVTVDPRFRQTTAREPLARFANAAAAVGNLDFPIGRDGVLRRAWASRGGRPSLAAAAVAVATRTPRQDRPRARDAGPPAVPTPGREAGSDEPRAPIAARDALDARSGERPDDPRAHGGAPADNSQAREAAGRGGEPAGARPDDVPTRDRARTDEDEDSLAARLIDYYGPARKGIRTRSCYQALAPREYLPEGIFEDAIVFVGLSQSAAAGPSAKDAFATPFRGPEMPPTFGVEIHATVAANLLEGRRIESLPPWAEAGYLIALPLAACCLFLLLRPLLGALLLAALLALPWGAGHLAFSRSQLWIPVVIPSLVQIPVAYVAALTWYYLTTVRQREWIRRAFAFYLSPEMIARIAADPGSLDLGGEEIVGTALMTDIEGFTTIAESLPPREVAERLNDYFTDLGRHVMGEGGTLVKFIGDAIFAIWGAPLKMEDHAQRACLAALSIARSVPPAPSSGRAFATRVGVHTGPMLVGNLGSKARFDYTAIGDAVNIASRLEGLNKPLGTKAIASAAALAGTDGAFLVRPLGRAVVAGRSEPIEIFELLGRKGETPPMPPEAFDAFGGALGAFRSGRFAEAADGFRRVLSLTGERDGPSRLYLRTAEQLVADPPGESWDGSLVFTSK